MPQSKETKVKDGAKVKAFLQGKGHKAAALNKQKWDTPDDIVESVVKLHGQTVESYKAGGLG